jgi:hypothetical protein
LTSYVNRIDELETVLWDLIWGWVLEHEDPDDPLNTFNASGNQLDDLGAIVGELREGRSDADYILAIKLRVRINRSKGRSSDMVEIAYLIDAAATYIEMYPLGWEVSLYDITNGGDIIRMLTQAKAASSYGVLLTSSWDEDEVFKFDHEGDETFVFGTETGSVPDVRFPMALPTNPPYRRS